MGGERGAMWMFDDQEQTGAARKVPDQYSGVGWGSV